jgi:hypothetical protein
VPWSNLGRTRCGSTLVLVHGANLVGRDLGFNPVKIHGVKLVDALWLHPVHAKIDMDANRLHISKQNYMCFGHGNAGPFISCIKENKELACYCHEERSCMGFYQIKEIIICANVIISKNKTLTKYCIFSPLVLASITTLLAAQTHSHQGSCVHTIKS